MRTSAIIVAMLHENHRRYLLSQFHHIDKLFRESLANLQTVDDGRLFNTHLPDATSAQYKILNDHVAQLRFLIQRFRYSQQLEDKPKLVSALCCGPSGPL
jgi:hypothetical protein